MGKMICIFCGASDAVEEKYKKAVYKLSKELGKKGYDLIYGAGGSGCMGQAALGFLSEGRYVLGITPRFMVDIEPIADMIEVDFVEDMAERKTKIEEKGDAFIIAPGGIGTMDEFFEVITLKKLGRLDKPIIVFNVDGYYDDLMKLNDFYTENGFAGPCCPDLCTVCSTVEDVEKALER